MPQPGKKSKKPLSTSSGSSTTDNKAKNFYERMSKEHQQIGSKKPQSLAEARNKYKTDKNKPNMPKSPMNHDKDDIEFDKFSYQMKQTSNEKYFDIDASAIDMQSQVEQSFENEA